MVRSSSIVRAQAASFLGCSGLGAWLFAAGGEFGCWSRGFGVAALLFGFGTVRRFPLIFYLSSAIPGGGGPAIEHTFVRGIHLCTL